MKKNLLIIGNSAKEFTLARLFTEDFNVFVAPGNDAISEFATVVDIRENNVAELVDFALENDIAFTICSSETAIKADIAKLFEMNNLKIFAPTAKSASFATNKSVGKKLMYKLKIPTPRFGIFEKKQLATDYVKNSRMPVVIKTDTHKPNSVMVCPTETIAKSFIEYCFFAGEEKVIIEEYVHGTNFSLYAITDGYKILPIGTTVDYKFSLEGNGGIITSGMGAYSPCIKLTEDQIAYIIGDIAYPLIDYLESQGTPYLGIIGFDGIVTSEGKISIFECNTFLRDHDAQCILSLINQDIYKLMEACVIGSFADDYNYIETKDEFAVAGVLSSGRVKNSIIEGLDDLQDNTIVAHLNTKRNEYLEYETQGSNALVVTTTAKTLSRATKALYEELEFIEFEGKKYRKDICNSSEA